MSRRTDGKPQLPRPRVILARIVGRHRHHPRTLTALASRALYVAGRAPEAEALRDALLAADPAEYLAILGAFVEFWPGGQAERFPIGDPALNWSSGVIPAEQRRKAA